MFFRNRLGKALTSVLAVISGILLFAAAAAASLDADLFNSSFHLNLINKYGVYSQLEKAVDNSLKNYLKDVESGPAEDEKQKEQLFSLVNSAVTPDMVKLNTDALVEGLMEYFSGEARFLPDVYLKPANAKPAPESNGAIEQASPAERQPLAGIDRISLNVLLMYMDRYDVINALSEIRLARFALSYAPVFLSLFSALLLVLAMTFAGGREVKARLSQAILAAGVSGIAASILVFGLGLLYLPVYLASSPLTKNFQRDALYGYLRACIERPAVLLAVFGVVLLAMAFITRLLPKTILKDIIRKLAPRPAFIKKLIRFPVPGVSKKYVKALAGTLLVLLLAGAFMVKAEAMKGDFHSKDLGAALERLRGINPYTRVIAARDGIIYSVEVRMVDRESGDPVQGLEMSLDGSSADGNKAYSESGTSDSSGKARFNITKGDFKLEFDPSKFPESYKMPAPYPFEITTAGTTIITVSLEKTEAKNPGIAELLILGADNKPLENLELMAEAEGGADSGKVYSFTNRDGVAVFKLPEGRYVVTFIESSFPGQYISPAPLGIETADDETVKYSLKLSTKEPQPKSKKSAKK